MINEHVVRREMLSILQRSLLPLSPGELAGEIWSRSQGRLERRPSELYSPRLRYSMGTRLFHPAEKFRQWLTVCEPVTDTYFRAVFDDGQERRLAHGDTTTAYPGILEGPEQQIETIVAAQAQTCPEVVEIEGLYVHRAVNRRTPFHWLSNPAGLVELARRRVQQKGLCRKDELRELCKRHGLKRLYYLAPLENVTSILERGILAKNLAPDNHASFAHEEIQVRRQTRQPDEGLKLTLHDYVPLFFAPKPPLLSSLRERQAEIVYFLVNPVILLEPGVVFSPVNASASAVFYQDIADLARLDWEVLQAAYWNSADEREHKENKRRRQAEAEIPVTVPPNAILDIVVYDARALRRVQEEVEKRKLPIKVRVDKGLYY